MTTVIIGFDGATYRVPGLDTSEKSARYTEACEAAMAIGRSIHGVQAHLEVKRVSGVYWLNRNEDGGQTGG